MKRWIAVLLSWLLGCIVSLPAWCAQTTTSITHEQRSGTISLAGGAVKTDKKRAWWLDGGIVFGLPAGFELGTPAVVTWAAIRHTPFEMALSLGITDVWISSTRKLLYTPSATWFAKVHLSHEAAALFAMDYTHVRQTGHESPGFLRENAAFMVDMGPYLTWCIGIAYQRIIVEHTLPEELDRSGMAGVHRVSIGSIRVTPYEDTPVFSIHLRPYVDIIGIIRVDIDSNTDTTNARYIGGVQVSWQ